MFFPRVQLKCDGKVILNTGDSIVAIQVDLDGLDSTPKGPFSESSVLKVKESSSCDKAKEVLCTSPEPNNKDFVWAQGGGGSVPSSPAPDPQPTSSKSEQCENVDSMQFVELDKESQKENTEYNSQDLKFERIKSPPKSPKNTHAQAGQKGLVAPCERWFEGLSLPQSSICSNINTQMPSPRRVRSSSNGASDFHTKDLYNFDSDDSEDNSYSFMCPSVPKALKAKSPSGNDIIPHPHNLVISPSVQLQRQLAFNANKASPLLNSQAFNCLSLAESPKVTFEQVLAQRGIHGIGRSFFSPSNSENSFGGTSSSADSVIVQVSRFFLKIPRLTYFCL